MKHSFLDHYSDIDSPLQRCDARVKLALTLAFIVTVVSTPPHHWLSFAVYAGLLLALFMLSRLPLRHLASRLLLLLPLLLLLVAFVPFLPQQGGSFTWGVDCCRRGESAAMLIWNVAGKSMLGVMAVILLSSTTSFAALLVAMYHWHCPRLLIMVASFAYRYLFVLVDEIHRLKRACDARGFAGKWLWQARFIGQIVGVMFLRAYERGERVYVAMLARGFDGVMVYDALPPLAGRDYAVSSCVLAVVIGGRLFHYCW